LAPSCDKGEKGEGESVRKKEEFESTRWSGKNRTGQEQEQEQEKEQEQEQQRMQYRQSFRAVPRLLALIDNKRGKAAERQTNEQAAKHIKQLNS
jgi:hypothetical protein